MRRNTWPLLKALIGHRLTYLTESFNTPDSIHFSASDKQLGGNQLSFKGKYRSQWQTAVMHFTVHVDGDTIRGTLDVEDGVNSGQQIWVAKRIP